MNNIGRLLLSKYGVLRAISPGCSVDGKIIIYKEKYREKVKNHLIEIAVDEYGFESWREAFRELTVDSFKCKKSNFWIAVDSEDSVIGTIGLRKIDNDTCELKSFYVKKDFRGTDISKKLFNSCIEFAGDCEYKKVILDTYDCFGRAINFYKKNGFNEVNKIGNRYIFERSLINVEEEVEELVLQLDAV